MPLTPDEQKLWQIFHPYAWEHELLAKNQSYRFAHYTRAESLFKILQTGRFWLRKTNCMNDFTEVQHGLNCLVTTYNKTDAGTRFKTTLNDIFTGFTSRVEALFNGWLRSILHNIYIACFSVHKQTDDSFGRLSMWRAYGTNTGLALVLKSDPSTTIYDVLKVATSPVAYLTDTQFQSELDRVTNNIAANKDLIKEQGSTSIEAYVFRMFRYAAVSVKHPSFLEEDEWRLLYSPDLEPSEHLQKSTEVINGVP